MGTGRGGAGQGARVAHRLGGGSDATESDAAAAESEAYEEVCGTWWAEVQEHARGQAGLAAAAAGSVLRVLEYSLFSDNRLVMWVLSGAGELLGSATVPSTGFGGTTLRDLLQEARGSMKVRGCDAMASVSAELNQERKDQQSDVGIKQGQASSERGNKCKGCGLKFNLKFNQCGCQETKEKATIAVDEVRERALLRELYAALVVPVEEHLTGAEEVLIVPHQLFEVPWAALIDAHGHFLIEHHVLRVARSLRVAQQAAV
jgi:hypothetical protein